MGEEGGAQEQLPWSWVCPHLSILAITILDEVNLVLQVPLFSTGVTGVEFSSVKEKTLSVNFE